MSGRPPIAPPATAGGDQGVGAPEHEPRPVDAVGTAPEGGEDAVTQPMPAPSRRRGGTRQGLHAHGPTDLAEGRPPRRRSGRLVAVLLLLLAAAAVAVIVVAKPFSSSPPSGSGAADNSVGISLASVERRSISAQQTENGTLGYAGSYTVVNQAGGSSGGEGHGGKGGAGSASAIITFLPAVGHVVRDGEDIYEVNGEPVVLLYGATPAYRTLHKDMSGKDVAELNSDLVGLGFATGAEIDEHPEYFGAETETALKAFQEARGVKEAGGVKLGQLALGQAIFLPSTTLRITSISGTLGTAVQQGSPIMQATSTGRQVVVKLDAAEQASIKAGDHVVITLPNNQTTAGLVSSVGKVAKSSSSGGKGGGEEEGAPSIEVQITPTDPQATGTLDQAPVRVAITSASADNVLVVPISALLALAEGGYAVEVAEGRSHRLVGVSLGLFDDADGLVQVSASGLKAGQQVVVPSK